MIEVTIPAYEGWDESKEEFVSYKGAKITLEHSLVSISKWESKWCKPFIEKTKKSNKTAEEFQDYIRCMTLTKDVPQDVYSRIPASEIKRIADYIDSPMSAVKYSTAGRKSSNQLITAETIYAQMFSLNIPMDCQKWHLNRLLSLIHVCADMQTPKKKMGKRAILNQNAALNAQRKAAMHTRG